MRCLRNPYALMGAAALTCSAFSPAAAQSQTIQCRNDCVLKDGKLSLFGGVVTVDADPTFQLVRIVEVEPPAPGYAIIYHIPETCSLTLQSAPDLTQDFVRPRISQIATRYELREARTVNIGGLSTVIDGISPTGRYQRVVIFQSGGANYVMIKFCTNQQAFQRFGVSARIDGLTATPR